MDSLTIYTDASVNPQNKTTGIGFHIKQNGETLCTNASGIEYHDSTQAEWKAILIALRYAITEYNPMHITLYTDAHSVAEVINSNSTPSQDTIHGLYWRYTQLAAEIEFISIRHIPSDLNKTADSLARYGRRSMEARTSSNQHQY